MQPLEIVTNLLSPHWAESLTGYLSFCDPEFAKVKAAFDEIRPELNERFGEDRIHELLRSELTKQTLSMVFSAFLGLRYNLESYRSVIPIDFVDQGKDRYLKEELLMGIPKYAEAQTIAQNSLRSLGENIEAYEETILEYFCHLDMVLPAWSHYLGYVFGNHFLKLVEPGYHPDLVQTHKYTHVFQ